MYEHVSGRRLSVASAMQVEAVHECGQWEVSSAWHVSRMSGSASCVPATEMISVTAAAAASSIRPWAGAVKDSRVRRQMMASSCGFAMLWTRLEMALSSGQSKLRQLCAFSLCWQLIVGQY